MCPILKKILSKYTHNIQNTINISTHLWKYFSQFFKKFGEIEIVFLKKLDQNITGETSYYIMFTETIYLLCIITSKANENTMTSIFIESIHLQVSEVT